jgi:hypothetical protein
MAREGTSPAYTDAEAQALVDAHAAVAAAHHAKTTSGDDLTSGTVADARVAATVARDAEVAAAILAHAALASAHHAKYTDAEADARAAALIATHAALPTVHQDAPGLIATHAAVASAHHTKTVDASELTTGELPAARIPAGVKAATITFIIDGGGSAITTGQKGHLEIPFACTIERVTMLADQSGSIVVDIWKVAYASFPPADGNSITASAPPTISTAQNSQDATLTGWTTAIAAGDILAFNVDSCATITRVTISLKVAKT